jgi:hypothetical protein
MSIGRDDAHEVLRIAMSGDVRKLQKYYMENLIHPKYKEWPSSKEGD